MDFGGLIGRREYAILGSAAGDAAQKAAAKAASDAAAAAAAKAAKGAAGDAAAKAAKEAAEEAAQTAAAKAAKGAAGDAAEKAAAKAAKEAAEEAAQKAAKEAAEKSAKEAAEKAGKDYGKYIGAAAAAGAGLYLYGSSADAADESNNTPRDITKIEKTQDEGFIYNIYFDPAIKILLTDAISISDSKTTPSIDGPQTVASVLGNNKITIDFGKELTSNTPGGAIKVTTTTQGQLDDTITETAKGVGSAAGGGIGGVLGGAFGGLGKALGIDPSKLKWGILIICLCALAIGLFMVLK